MGGELLTIGYTTNAEVHEAWRELFGSFNSKMTFLAAVFEDPAFGEIFGLGEDVRGRMRDEKLALVLTPMKEKMLVKIVTLAKLPLEEAMTPIQTYKKLFTEFALSFQRGDYDFERDGDVPVRLLQSIFRSLSEGEQKELARDAKTAEYLNTSLYV